MRGFLVGLSVSVAFILGCAASRVLVPPAHAQYAGPKWDYFCQGRLHGDDQVAEAAKRAGAEGWEMVAVNSTNNVWCFKRPAR